MRARRLVATAASAAALAGVSGPAWAGALKVMNVDPRSMTVLDGSTVRRTGDRVAATLLITPNRGYATLESYEHPWRASLSLDCASQAYSLGGGPVRPISPESPVARTADWLCKGVAPPNSTETGNFGSLARAYLAYVAVTPGVFFVYNP